MGGRSVAGSTGLLAWALLARTRLCGRLLSAVQAARDSHTGAWQLLVGQREILLFDCRALQGCWGPKWTIQLDFGILDWVARVRGQPFPATPPFWIERGVQRATIRDELAQTAGGMPCQVLRGVFAQGVANRSVLSID
jgi:hypothetical protein